MTTTTKFIIEMVTDGIPNLDKILPLATNRFADKFTQGGVTVKSCFATLQPVDPIEWIGLTVRNTPPVMPVEDEV